MQIVARALPSAILALAFRLGDGQAAAVIPPDLAGDELVRVTQVVADFELGGADALVIRR